MENELLKIFDEQWNHIGEATRTEVHRLGLWHEAFHCWFIGKENDSVYIYLQLRSEKKDFYPNLLDITAAGHLLAHETVADGVREINEEIGIDVTLEELIPLGVVPYCVEKENIIDKEMAHVYLYETNHSFADFVLQEEEVTGMVRVPFYSFYDLWLGNTEQVLIEGFKIGTDGRRVTILAEAGKEKFVQHVPSYYEKVLEGIKRHLCK
ncbi:NUDIX hydrolase [Neobacillus niacini]|uniref:NUDIX hydrolase n=1 Tax=Neobacillus niacini TaxID=86668 RepID=UPI0021CB814C|nr:NUDIX hydrolase [Neobacillus niacini]MCM3764757.1 NUDIX hydrolase [Neobacillus niacini]